MPDPRVSHANPRSEAAANAAAYIADLSGNLAAIARDNGLETLGYLLDMAKLEAENEARLLSERR